MTDVLVAVNHLGWPAAFLGSVVALCVTVLILRFTS
jgi:hypothetical protein